MICMSVKELLNLKDCACAGNVECFADKAYVVFDWMSRGFSYYRKYLLFHRSGEIEAIIDCDSFDSCSKYKLTAKNADEVFKKLSKTIQSIPVPTWRGFKVNPECVGGGYDYRDNRGWDSGKYLLHVQQALFRLMAEVRKTSK